mmetsp:Transcript_17132/g.65380  ORF Transcript_17132/g.65380 Transcript_17132/m.65380 type:complete len:273 (-) Transcript_17132:22-840(-)
MPNNAAPAAALVFVATVVVFLMRRYASGEKSSKRRICTLSREEVAGHALFLDCDDTLYFNDWVLARELTGCIDKYCVEELGLSPDRAFELYKMYGTCFRGLQIEKVKGFETEDFLAKVHDPIVPSLQRLIQPDGKLQEMLKRLRADVRARVFTASCSEHATRCLKALGIYGMLIDAERPIIDVRKVDFYTKHDNEAYGIAMKLAGVTDPSQCWIVDDSWTNIRIAKKNGWNTVLCGSMARDGRPAAVEMADHADYIIDSIHDLGRVLPQFFD